MKVMHGSIAGAECVCPNCVLGSCAFYTATHPFFHFWGAWAICIKLIYHKTREKFGGCTHSLTLGKIYMNGFVLVKYSLEVIKVNSMNDYIQI